VFNNALIFFDLLGREPAISVLTGNPVDSGAPLSSHGAGVNGQNPSPPQAGLSDAINLGLDFLTGTTNPNQTYGPNSPMTEAIKNSWQADVMRSRVKAAAKAHCDAGGSGLPAPVGLGGEVGEIGDIEFVANFFTDLVSNPMSSFTGSFSGGEVTFVSIDCGSCTASISVNAINNSSAQSATRLPSFAGGYSGNGPMTGLFGLGGFTGGSGPLYNQVPTSFTPFSTVLDNNPNGSGGPGNTITQNYNWSEDVEF
jgi:hypothetical protein